MLERVPRDPEMLETLQLFRRVMGADSDPADASAVAKFLQTTEHAIKSVKDNPTRIAGTRVQALFAQMVVALDGCQMMLSTDAGEVYGDGFTSAGDFLLILRDGRRLLVEVKAALEQKDGYGRVDYHKSLRTNVRAKVHDAFQHAASLLDAEPFYAVYFEPLRLWALSPAGDLTRQGTNYELELSSSMISNRLNLLGDRWIGVVPPIELRICPEEPVPFERLESENESAVAEFTIADAPIFVGGQRIIDRDDWSFAFFLYAFGTWNLDDHPVVNNGFLEHMSFIAEPEVPSGSGSFELVGSLSQMYSAYFMLQASDASGIARKLDVEPTPSLVAKFLKRHPKERQFGTWIFDVGPDSGTPENRG